MLSASGIAPATTVVLYGDNNGFAAWATSSSCTATPTCAVLDGGRKYWLDAGLPLSTDVPSYAPTGYTLSAPDFALRRAFRD